MKILGSATSLYGGEAHYFNTLVAKQPERKSAAGIAKAIHRAAIRYCGDVGQRTEHCILWSPQESQVMGYGGGWNVSWVEGPYEWPMALTGYVQFEKLVECQNNYQVVVWNE
jgi:hypothetical protein